MTIRDCRHIQPRLSEYVDGALREEETWQVRQHLATCAVCARIADDFSRTATLLRQLPVHEPSADFEARLARRLADHVLPSATPWWRPRLRPALWTSGVAFATLLPLCLLWSQRVTPPGPGASPSAVASSDAAVAELWCEHVSSESEEPLGGPSPSILVASAEGIR